MKVSIIISNRNDVQMLCVTIRSCIEELRPLQGQGEIVVVDNSDAGEFNLLRGVLPVGYCRDKILQIHRQPFPCLFSARESAAKYAKGEYILCLDSHMIVPRDGIVDLVNFMDSHSDDQTMGFAHAPINWAHHHERNAKHDRDMSVNELGPWGTAYDHVRTITWKGMPWICRRKWFLDRDKGLGGYGALSDHHISWGGGDLHIGVKPWLLGFKNWAVPTHPFIHIGPFPKVDGDLKDETVEVSSPKNKPRYRLYGTSGNFPHTFGFLVACYVLGGEEMMLRNEKIIKEKFGRYMNLQEWWPKAIEIGTEERKWLLSRQKMTFLELLERKPWSNSQ